MMALLGKRATALRSATFSRSASLRTPSSFVDASSSSSSSSSSQCRSFASRHKVFPHSAASFGQYGVRPLAGRPMTNGTWYSGQATAIVARTARGQGQGQVRCMSMSKMKEELREKGPVLLVWWTFCWLAPIAPLYFLAEYFQIDPAQMLEDATGFHVTEHVNKDWATLGGVVAFNEAMEVFRAPLVFASLPAVVRIARRWAPRLVR